MCVCVCVCASVVCFANQCVRGYTCVGLGVHMCVYVCVHVFCVYLSV